MEHYDIFISYKRKSLPTANNLYYRLTIRGYSTFFDLEELGKDNFDTQLLKNIENAKDVFVVLENGSFDDAQEKGWEKDWFCREIAFALEKKKNIIPLLVNGYKMPVEEFFPDNLKELSHKNSPEFSFSFFDSYLNKLVEKKYITSEAHQYNKITSIFKFYSNENCKVYKEGKIVCSLKGMSEEPYYLPVPRKGDYRFRCDNPYTEESIEIRKHIDAEEEQDIQIIWGERRLLKREYESSTETLIKDRIYTIELGALKFNMIRVDGNEASHNPQMNHPDETKGLVNDIAVSTFYIGQFPVTQNIWEYVMGYNKSDFKEKEHGGKELLELKKRKKIVENFIITFGVEQNVYLAGVLLLNKVKNNLKNLKSIFGNHAIEEQTTHQKSTQEQAIFQSPLTSLVNKNPELCHNYFAMEFVRLQQIEVLLSTWLNKDMQEGYSDHLPRVIESVNNDYVGSNVDLEPRVNDCKNRIAKLSEEIVNSSISTDELVKRILHTNKYMRYAIINDDFGHFPVENISIEEALKFVGRLSIISGIPFSIPTSEEWEYASKGGQKRKDSSGSELENFDNIAWYKDNSENTIHPVGEKRYNELNLYDMYGNVSELTELTSNDNVYARCGGDWSCESSECLNTRPIIQNSSKRIKGMGLRVVIRENVG